MRTGGGAAAATASLVAGNELPISSSARQRRKMCGFGWCMAFVPNPCSFRSDARKSKRRPRSNMLAAFAGAMAKTLVLLFCLFPVLAFAAPPAPLLLTHVTVIDGSGAPPQQDMTIAVNGDRIADVYRSGSKPDPENAQVHDLRGRFAIPGLIDAHVHLTGAEPDIAHYKDHLRALMLGGVTGLRDMA